MGRATGGPGRSVDPIFTKCRIFLHSTCSLSALGTNLTEKQSLTRYGTKLAILDIPMHSAGGLRLAWSLPLASTIVANTIEDCAMRTYTGRARRFASAVVAAILCATGPAYASLYVGSWDPKFGAPFENLNFAPAGLDKWDLTWEGSFKVNADCPANGTLANCTGPASVVEVSVTLSRPARGPVYPLDTGASATISFSPASIVISDLIVAGDVITQLKTDLANFSPAASADTALATALSGRTFAVGFVINGQGTAGSDLETLLNFFPNEVDASYSGPVLFTAVTGRPLQISVSNILGGPDFLPRFTGLVKQDVQRVPEPDAVALIVGALLGVGLVRRRRLVMHLS